QESSWQKKKIVFERENGTQKIEERVTAESTDHEYFSSQDRDTQGKVKKESELILILEDGQRIRLNNLLPPEFSLRPYLNEEAHPVNQRHLDRFGKLPIPLKEYQGNDKQSQESDGKILGSSKKIIYGDLRRKGGLFWLLHEVGHAWDQHDDPTNNELESNLYQLLQRLKEQQPEGHHAPSVDDSQVQLNQDCYDTESQPLVVKKDVLVRIVQEGIDSERGATVFALNLASILEKEGIDIDPGMSGDEIYESIESALAGYQHDVLETYYHTPEDLEKMKDHSFV
ncbi:MAG: hypothetical protein KKF65_00255, partial [Nanoarchaeota archaeon]|nr:hypothetical protein [Nanoarchaeota archaeon]